MKKTGVMIVLFLLVFSLVPLILSAENDTCEANEDCGTGEICDNELCIIEDDTTDDDDETESQQDPEKIDEAFLCLEDKADDCSGLTTQEIALTILATPDNIFDDCVEELIDKESSDNWGNVRDTALAIIALKHAGEDTTDYEEWLLEQEQTPTELIWYLQEDSNEQTECHIGYDAKDYLITIGENKKIDKNAGSCLTRAQSNFWLQINSNCFEEEFIIECDKDFIANLLYRNQKSSTIYVLEGTESSPAFGSISLSVKSKCFGKNSCEYEATAWATLALLLTGHNVEEFIPYVIAMSDTNEGYLPEAFIYMLTNYEDYASQLVASQKLGNYWEAENSAYNRHYDTSLALLALGSSSSSEQITKARDWLLFSQGSNGCWSNSIKDTAMALWALEGRAGRASSGGGVTYCSEAGYFCVPTFECPASEDVGNNYFCGSLSDTCCMSENLKSCSEYGGSQCESTQVCAGNSRKSTDIETCCTGECVEKPTESECEENFYTCMDECSEFQESISTYSCDGVQVCCRTKTESEPSSSWWIWMLIILILITLGAIGYIYREKIKLWWFQFRSKFKKDKGKKGPGPRPGMPPRPGFPPVRRAPTPVAQQKGRPYDRRDPQMSATFKKLREMSK